MATRRGDLAKQEVTNIIKKAFGDSFICIQDKKIYLNVKDGADIVQIAVSLTMPKVPVADGAQTTVSANALEGSTETVQTVVQAPVEISPEDKQQVARLKTLLGITT